ncbi:MAG: ABC transporter substrate-binding protein, partial [Candidatus Hodarchaeota archaeon]
MGRIRSLKHFVLTWLIVVILFALVPAPADAQAVPYEDAPNQGPYVDKVLFKFGYDTDNKIVLGLQSDSIDMHVNRLHPLYALQLEESENFEVTRVQRNGYGIFTINCAKYPYNITAFRRALAFALDKEGICEDVWVGEAHPQDSPVPAVNPYSIEGQLPYTYYASHPEIGNQLLDDAGFLDRNADGWREAPDGSPLHVVIEHGAVEGDEAWLIVEYAVEAFRLLHISAENHISQIYEILGKVNHNLDFDIVFFGFNYGGAYFMYLTDYVTSNIGLEYHNAPNWGNATYDQLANIILTENSFDEILDAVEEMQRIFVYECPRIPVYCDNRFHVFRKDVFEIPYRHKWQGIATSMTYRKVHRTLDAGGPWGGIFRVGTELPSSLNFMLENTIYSGHILRCLMMRMFTQDQDGFSFPELADSWSVEYHEDNPIVPDGHTRVTINLIRNATWSDGNLITADDMAFSLNYYRDGVACGNPLGVTLLDMTAAFAAAPFRLVVEFSTESYWHLDFVTTFDVIPKHIFEDLGLEAWREWDPLLGHHELISSGAFEVGEYLPGEFLELNARLDWAFGLGHLRPESTTSTEATTTPTEPVEGMNPMLV